MFGSVVISGISGRLPESESVSDFQDKLFSGVDMVTEDGRRWPPGTLGLPGRNGKLKEINKFDASFFGIAPKQANSMDPQLRILLEVVYEAIFDAGVDPQSIRGSSVGVFVGSIGSESREPWGADSGTTDGYVLTGCTQSMLANRLSYYFDFKGPSYCLDTACSSGLLALNHAMAALSSGQCTAAVVAGSNLCLNPVVSLQFQHLNMLSADGTCRSFDAAGSGYVRSEGVVAVFLQMAPQARRAYASLVHADNNADGHKEDGITFPSGTVQRELLARVYRDCGVRPQDVVYVEAHGTGTEAGDPQELNAITQVFCPPDREEPLLIGSVKSNMGHSEPTSGLAAIAKVVIAMETNEIPGNLHYNTPNPHVPALVDGRLKVVAETTRWLGGYVGVSSFGFGGTNVHVVLKSNPGKRDGEEHPDGPRIRLFTFSARTQEGLEQVLSAVQNNPRNVAMQALLQANSHGPMGSLPYRGYCLVNHAENCRETRRCAPGSRPVWFVFTGMGCQWAGMGRGLLQIDVFRRSLEESDAVLKRCGVELLQLIRGGDEETFKCVLNSFVCIVAIQKALVDVLHCVGVRPDGIVGHSVGEMSCAYADGALTSDELLLTAYWRGRCLLDAELPPGGMAAVGLTWQEAKARCPEDIVPACHNSKDSVTVSGPAEAVSKFVAKLRDENIFAKEVNCSGVPFHSPLLHKVAPTLRKSFQKVIKENRPRSKRWLSTSVPQSSWGSDLALYSSADFYVNNVISPVLFYDAVRHIPDNAIVLEIGPHGLLQANVKRSLGAECTFLSLMKRNHPNNAEFMLSSLGKLHMAGVDMEPLKLHSPVPFPVPPGTPMLASLVQWDHSQTWRVPTAQEFGSGAVDRSRTTSTFVIDVSSTSKERYLRDHKIDGRILYPAAGYIVLAWRALARFHAKEYTTMAVVLEDVHIHRATVLRDQSATRLHVILSPSTGRFEINNDDAILLVAGKIRELPQPSGPVSGNDVMDPTEEEGEARQSGGTELPLNTDDAYTELRIRGYEYGPAFQGINSVEPSGRCGRLLWSGNWITFLDSLLQMELFSSEGLRLPTRIKSIRIDPFVQNEKSRHDSGSGIPVTVDSIMRRSVCGGAEITGLHAVLAAKRKSQDRAVLTQYTFVPFRQIVHVEDGQSYLRECIASMVAGMGVRMTSHQKAILEKYAASLDAKKVKSKNVADFENGSKKFLCYLDRIFSNGAMANEELEVRPRDDVRVDDRLLGCMKQPEVLKPCLNTVIENCVTVVMEIKIVEFGDGQFYKKLLPWIHDEPQIVAEYILVVDKTTTDDDSVTLTHGVSVCQWQLQGKCPDAIKSADLIILDEVCFDSRLPDRLRAVCEGVKAGGFVLLHGATIHQEVALFAQALFQNEEHDETHAVEAGALYSEDDVIEAIVKSELKLVAHKSSDLLYSMFLCRKMQPLNGGGVGRLLDVSSLAYGWVEEIKEELATDRRLWLYSSAKRSGLLGLVASLRREAGGRNVRCFLLDGEGVSEEELGAQMELDLVVNVRRVGGWGQYTHLPLLQGVSRLAEHAYANVLTRGDLTSLRWIESPLGYVDIASVRRTGQDVCSIYHAALNFRDVMLATGKLPPDALPRGMSKDDCLLGMEYSGIDSTGRRIMGILPAKGLATTAVVSPRFTWPVPEKWSLRGAASVPVAYSTAYYALVARGRIQQGEIVLIHSGSGGVGQAAIAIALHCGCEVYTTVGTAQKCAYLKGRFPQLQDHHFANSRDNSFVQHVMRATHGHGCDVILNSLSEEKLQASLRCLATNGRFLEIGKYDLANNTALGMAMLLNNITVHGIVLDALFTRKNTIWDEVFRLVAEGLQTGVVRPLSTTVFDLGDIEKAFRFMAQGKHIGKVLLQMREEKGPITDSPVQDWRNIQNSFECQRAEDTRVEVQALARSYCHPRKCYVITGGLGGFGLQLTQWLIDRGATIVILTSRFGVKTGFQSLCLRRWNNMAGVSVKVVTKDASSLDEAEQLIQYATSLAPVGGIFHLAMVLHDALMEDQTQESFQTVCAPKVKGADHLDKVTRRLCADMLEWFVVFSSFIAYVGNRGVTNYAFANSYMERVCESRIEDGLPGKCDGELIDTAGYPLGVVGDVGVTFNPATGGDTVICGGKALSVMSCLAELDRLLNQTEPVVSCYVTAGKMAPSRQTGSDETDVCSAVARVLGLSDPNSVNLDATLVDLGLDSLMGVEVKEILERKLERIFKIRDIRLLTFHKISTISSAGDAVLKSAEV